MLMKLTTGGNFTNTLHAAFFVQKYLCKDFRFMNFWHGEIGKKAALKMLVKLATECAFKAITTKKTLMPECERNTFLKCPM